MTSHRSLLRIIALLAALTLVAAACGDDDDTAVGDDGSTTADDGAADAGADADADDGSTTADDGAADADADDGSTTADDGAAAAGTVVATATTDLGEVLVSGEFTLYIFTPDPPGETTCFDDCAALWPPLTARDGVVTAGAGVDEAGLGTIERPDGTTQVTYEDRPLYFYAPDGPGDTSGQGVGGIWFVVEPSGDIVGASTGAGPGY